MDGEIDGVGDGVTSRADSNLKSSCWSNFP